MKLLITGGGGFIGSHIIEYYTKLGDEILVIDNFYTGTFVSYDEGIKLLPVSLTDIHLYQEQIEAFSPEVVIHAAATYSEPDNWLLDINSNISGTVHLIKVCKKLNLTKFIYLQTSLSYGLFQSDESIPNHAPYFSGGYYGGSSYAISKATAELYLSISGLPFISFRLGNIFGPRNFSGPIPIFFYNLKSGRKSLVVDSSREFLFVKDLINCIDLVIKSSINKGYYNISSEKATSILDLFHTIASQLGVNVTEENFELKKVSVDDTSTLSLDCIQTKRDFGWETLTPLDLAISETLTWYEMNGINKTFTHLKIF